MLNSIYTAITRETVEGARNRALDELNRLTNDGAELAIRLVSECLELDSILKDFEEREAVLNEGEKC